MANRLEKGSGFNTPLVFMAALAVLLFVYALSLFLQGGFLTAYDLEYQVKVMQGEHTETMAAEAEQQAILDQGYRWVDQDKGKVGLPIEDAKTLVVNKGR